MINCFCAAKMGINYEKYKFYDVSLICLRITLHIIADGRLDVQGYKNTVFQTVGSRLENGISVTSNINGSAVYVRGE